MNFEQTRKEKFCYEFEIEEDLKGTLTFDTKLRNSFDIWFQSSFSLALQIKAKVLPTTNR